MSPLDSLDAHFGPWQQEADRSHALGRLGAFYYRQKEALIEPLILKETGSPGYPIAASSLPGGGESIRDEVRESLAQLQAWYWRMTRAILEHYERKG